MTHGKLTAAAGEKSCEICGDPLPALEYCPGKKHFVCDKPKCRHRIFEIDRKTIEVKTEEKTCDRPGCNKFVPPGFYYDLREKFFCGPDCQDKVYRTGAVEVSCAYCGKPVKTYKCLQDRRHYCNQREFGLHLRELNIKSRAGRFEKILGEYTEQYCPTHYKPASIKHLRCELLLFFEYLNLKAVKSLEKVNPKIITDFIIWSNQRGATKNRVVRFLVRFFNWMIMEGRRKAPNPIIPGFHKQGSGKRHPRPYTDHELAYIWRILEERGDTQARLALAIGEECGLRIGELVRLKVGDVDLTSQQVFVDIPNKTDTERYVPFHEKTKKYASLWKAERDPHCGHNYLFYNILKRPATVAQMQCKLNAILCQKSRNVTHDHGLQSFSYHRCRHVLCTRLGNSGADAATIMAVGGWKSFSAMQGYMEVHPSTVRKGYSEAMAKIAQQREDEAPTVQSLDDFAASDDTSPRNL